MAKLTTIAAFLIGLAIAQIPAMSQSLDTRTYQFTAPIRVNQYTPGTCSPWEMYINSTDNHTYECVALNGVNTWENFVRISFPRGTTASLPATCTVGDPFIATDATSSGSPFRGLITLQSMDRLNLGEMQWQQHRFDR
jgi:hypothetical protein